MFKHQFNFVAQNATKEKVNDKISQTSPDMSYSVRELLAKFTSGQPLPVKVQPIYDENVSFDSIPNPIDWDLTDITEAQLEVQQLNENIEAAQQALAAKKAEEEAAKQTTNDAENS